MAKDMFITSSLCKIKDQLADPQNKEAGSEGNMLSNPSAPALPKISAFERLSPETQRALISRQEEYERFRKDVLFRLKEMMVCCSQQSSEADDRKKNTLTASKQLDDLMKCWNEFTEPDRNAENFQIQLAENCRKLEKMRLDMIDLQGILTQKQSQTGSPSTEYKNFWAEFDSLSFRQLCKVGFSLFFPLILVLFLCGILLSAVIVMTFRVNL